MFLPGIDFTREHSGIRNAPVEALTGEDGQLGFGEVQPAAVLGRVMPLEPLDQAARLGRLESLLERGGDVRVQIVLDQHDLLGIGEVHIAQILENAGIIDRCAMLGDLDVAKAFERGE